MSAPSASAAAAVCTVAELASAPGQKLLRRLPSGRGIVLWLLRGGGAPAARAAGAAEGAAAGPQCYHHGGPLCDGDIEDLALPPALAAAAGRATAAVVLCPWHLYKIDVRSGHCYYTGSAGEVKSKGVRQRTHGVVIDAAGGVHVLEGGGGGGELPSDAYAALPFRTGAPVGSIHSSIGRARPP